MVERIEEYLEQIPMWAVKKNSLSDIRAYMERLGNPDQSMKIIHVAGTNGKGSVCAFLTAVLTEAGYKVGTFLSPHLEETRERFWMNGDLVRQDTYEMAFDRVKRLSDQMVADGYQPPTYFEFLFYMSMVINAQCKPDFVILETGLGGRLDVTNVIKNPVADVITSISMDHMQYLGNRIEEIAWEKAGIIKPGAPVIYDDSCPEASAVIRKRAEELRCRTFPVCKKDVVVMSRNEEDTKASIRSIDGGQLVVDVPSIADYQLMNVAVAVKALEVMKKSGDCRLTPGDISAGISHSCWPGRMEQALPGLYLDGAHNAGGTDALVKTAARLQKETGKKIHLLFAAVSDKEHGRMIAKLCEGLSISSVSVACMETERSADLQELLAEFREKLDCPVAGFSTAEGALNHLLQMRQEGDLAFCLGSLYLIGEIKQALRKVSLI